DPSSALVRKLPASCSNRPHSVRGSPCRGHTDRKGPALTHGADGQRLFGIRLEPCGWPIVIGRDGGYLALIGRVRFGGAIRHFFTHRFETCHPHPGGRT